MGMKDPRPTFSHLVSEAAKMYPDLAYLHVVEPRISGGADQDPSEGDSNDFLRDIWGPRPFISSGGYTRQSAIGTADSMGNLVAFGRLFIANVSAPMHPRPFTMLTSLQPDLPLRLKEDIPLTKPIRDLFYAPLEPKGYIDYPFATATAGPVRA
jgi:NADPH2 dehydrogenase